MAKIKTSDLKGNALDCAVGMCKPMGLFLAHGLQIGDEIAPTKNKAQCDAIIAQARLVIFIDGAYHASRQADDGTLTSTQIGQSEAEAYLRCFVHSHFGDEIDIPDFLLNEEPIEIGLETPFSRTLPPSFNESIRVYGIEDTPDHSNPRDAQHHRALRDALRLMIDATGRHADVPLEEARRKAIQTLSRVEEENGSSNNVGKWSFLNKIGRWLCSK